MQVVAVLRAEVRILISSGRAKTLRLVTTEDLPEFCSSANPANHFSTFSPNSPCQNQKGSGGGSLPSCRRVIQ